MIDSSWSRSQPASTPPPSCRSRSVAHRSPRLDLKAGFCPTNAYVCNLCEQGLRQLSGDHLEKKQNSKAKLAFSLKLVLSAAAKNRLGAKRAKWNAFNYQHIYTIENYLRLFMSKYTLCSRHCGNLIRGTNLSVILFCAAHFGDVKFSIFFKRFAPFPQFHRRQNAMLSPCQMG